MEGVEGRSEGRRGGIGWRDRNLVKYPRDDRQGILPLEFLVLLEEIQTRMEVQQLLEEWHEVVLVDVLRLVLLYHTEEAFDSIVRLHLKLPELQECLQLYFYSRRIAAVAADCSRPRYS